MLHVNGGRQVWLALGATDMRKQINGLSALVEQVLELNVFSGHLFVFCNKKRTMIRILYWQHNGFCLWTKRLEKQYFRWPESGDDVRRIRARELAWLLDGLKIDEAKKQGFDELSYEAVS
jgi:transposase